MKSVQELRHEYMNIREQMKDLVNRAKAEGRDLNGEENATFLRMHNDQEELSRAIEDSPETESYAQSSQQFEHPQHRSQSSDPT